MKRRRLRDGDGDLVPHRAENIDTLWAVDFIFYRTTNGPALKIFIIIYEFTRECIGLEAFHIEPTTPWQNGYV